MNEPVAVGDRTCAGCRETDARDALLRFVADGDPPRLAPDTKRRAPGRGVSVHARFRCVEAAVRNGALRRGLGVEAKVSARELSESASGQYTR
ncbi:MAG: YlxR family protein, partial [Polyangiales bacterium]